MASYKQRCIHCSALTERDARYCVACGSASPFGYACPNCLKPIEKGWKLCPGCGRSLVAVCPKCRANTFVQAKCELCGASLMVTCPNPRCGQPQFFENTKCTACGKKIVKK